MSEKLKSSMNHLEAIMRVLVYIEEHLDGPLGLEELAGVNEEEVLSGAV